MAGSVVRRRSADGWVLPPLDAAAPDYLTSGIWTRETVADVARARVAEAPDRLIIADDTVKLSRRELYEQAVRLGEALSARGLGPGSVVAFQLPNWHEACVISTASALYGFVLCPLLMMYRERELGFVLAETGCDALFLPGAFRGFDYRGLYDRVASGLVAGPQVFSVRDPERPQASYERLLAEPGVGAPLPDVDPESIKFVVFTSGTTGRPKGVLHSHYTAHATVLRSARFWGLDASDHLLVPSPVGHVGGSLYAFELPWFTGASARLMEAWDAAHAAELIERHGGTFCAGATPFLQGLVQEARSRNSTLPTLRRFICGGASVPEGLVEEACAVFEAAVVSRAYGSSEVPLVCPGVRDRADAAHGRTTDGEIDADVLILDGAGKPQPSGQEGDIVVRSPSAFIGYLESEDEAGQFTDDGYFRMGDMGVVVDDAYLKITGRRKELIIRLGENISPLEIETALLQCEAVKRVAVVGLSDPRTGERAVAFVELHPGHRLGFADMQAYLQAYGLAKQKFPEELCVLERLPTNSVGKVMKLDLKRLAEEDVPGAFTSREGRQRA
ncbi:AMP-binding protein [Amorphus sp. 3PC139-8]|uniref:AMP-binding protein n=1 Tax=Amorphus sp. 3PC139-8 TaxID=2735676 RepID=UPI00345C97E2